MNDFAGKISDHQKQENQRSPAQKHAGITLVDNRPSTLQRKKQSGPQVNSGHEVIQLMTVDAYLETLKLKDGWDDDYEEDLADIASFVKYQVNRAVQNPKYLDRIGVGSQLKASNIVKQKLNKVRLNDDATKENWNEYISYLGQNKELSKTEFDVYRFLLGQIGKPGRGSLRSLNFEGEEIVGRPSFDDDTLSKLNTPAKKHRRHIIAWHNIRAFANKVYAEFGEEVIGILDPLLGKLKKLSIYGRVETKVQSLNLDANKQKLLIAVFLMNSNTRNLWVGSGQENSGINTAAMTVVNAMQNWKSILGMLQTLEKWDISKQDAKTITDKVKKMVFDYAFILICKTPIFGELKTKKRTALAPVKDKKKVDTNKQEQEPTQLSNEGFIAVYGQWKRFCEAPDGVDPVAIRKGIIEDVRQSITDWIISHLEFDLGFSEEETNRNLDRTGIAEATRIFYKVLFKDGALDKEEVGTAFGVLLDLPAEDFKEKEPEEKEK